MSSAQPAQNNFSDAELAAYQIKKGSLFKGTIAVCVIYGVFAVLLLVIAFTDVRGRQMLSEDFLPFTITFVAGMIIVIIMLVIQITTFKPQKFETIMYDRDMCPDYWKAVPATQTEMEAGVGDDTADQSLKRIKCVPDPDVFALDYQYGTGTNANKFVPIPTTFTNTVTNIYGQTVKSTTSGNVHYKSLPAAGADPNFDTTLSNVATSMYGSDSNLGGTVLQCDKVFPALMAKEDEILNPDKPNALRCKYADLCGINWSSVC